MSYRLDFDPSDDFAIFDGQETVDVGYQHWDPATDGYGTLYTVRALYRSGEETKVPIGNGETAVDQNVIHIPAADLTATPHDRDKITRYLDSGDTEVWIVKDINEQTWGTRYRLTITKV